MARPRKPTSILQLNGAFKRNPARGRARANEPVPVLGIGGPPRDMPENVQARYREIVGLCHQGVLSKVDALIVEQASYLLHTLSRRDGMFRQG